MTMHGAHALLRDFNIEIGGGLGPDQRQNLAHRRDGLFGAARQYPPSAFGARRHLEDFGHPVERGGATSAAQNVYDVHEAELERDNKGMCSPPGKRTPTTAAWAKPSPPKASPRASRTKTELRQSLSRPIQVPGHWEAAKYFKVQPQRGFV